jgi:hypothetical protein
MKRVIYFQCIEFKKVKIFEYLEPAIISHFVMFITVKLVELPVQLLVGYKPSRMLDISFPAGRPHFSHKF